ncbi:HD-GYP domain-containing protein [Thalassotalea sp. PLHSN55]|uniref:HD-GYP domain-containing protein n=1 Tax=Thalassotalea sp. PLHSN55 TaxID=3435888 RepID=UPI003F87A100
MTIEISIDELQVGHFVISIAEQSGHYHLTEQGLIKSNAVINNLRVKGITRIQVDLSQSKFPSAIPSSKSQQATDDLPLIESPMLAEVKSAKRLFKRSKNIAEKVYQDVSAGRKLDVMPVIDITNNTIDTIFTNPDALACVINIRRKDDYLLEHSVAVSVLMTLFCRYLQIDRATTEQLAIGAFLHDVGKIMIPEHILHKPGKLTEAEFTVMKTHVNHSINIIKQTDGISAISLEVATLHHEKLNGTGYPFAVPGEEISRFGRMITICDIFDALTANRVYKEGFSHVKSFSILRQLAQDNQLDTQLVDQFIKCMGVYPVGSLVQLGSNKLAIVESRNDHDPVNPQVRTFYRSDRNSYERIEDIDLATNDDFIEKEVRADDFDLDMNQIIEFILMEG